MAVDEPGEQAATTPVVLRLRRLTAYLGDFRDPPCSDGDRRMLQHDTRPGSIVRTPHIRNGPTAAFSKSGSKRQPDPK